MAKAIQYSQLGGPEVLTLNDVPDPVAAPGQVTVRVEAVGVNPIDWKLRSGIRPSPPFNGPRGTGADGAGVVTSVGEGVDGLRVGMPVAFMNATGAYASEIAIDASDVYQRPSGVSAAEGAALGIPASTAYQAVLSLGVSADDVVLVHGGSGAVGQFVVQFARLAGATVIATASERRHATVERLGGIPVVYGDGVVERVRQAAGREVTVAIDCAGAPDAFTASVALVADRSRIVTIVRGAEADEWGVRAFMGGSPHALTAQQLAWRQDAMPVSLALLAAGALHVEIGEVRPLAEAAQAQAASEAGTDGKLILVP